MQEAVYTKWMSFQLLFCWLLKCCYSGWHIVRYLQVVPWGFRKLLNWIAKEYNNPPVLVTENGFSDHGETEDRDRIDFYIVSFKCVLKFKFWISLSVCISLCVTIFSTKLFLANLGYQTQFNLLFCFDKCCFCFNLYVVRNKSTYKV